MIVGADSGKADSRRRQYQVCPLRKPAALMNLAAVGECGGHLTLLLVESIGDRDRGSVN